MELQENPKYLGQLDRLDELRFLDGKTLFISGASGMLGSCLVDAVMRKNQTGGLACWVIAGGRSEEKLYRRFHKYIGCKGFTICVHDVCRPQFPLKGHIDYIIHAASNADPISMAEAPADTLLANVNGTKNLIEYGRLHEMKRFLFVSSGEVYGQAEAGREGFLETCCGQVSLEQSRSCYPEGKRAAEVLCQCCANQYGTDVVIVRPCHLFGPTMVRNDGRAAAEFLWAAAQGEDVLLKSNGLRERSHCYVIDAVSAILLVLEWGQSGNAYNIADRRYQMTLREFAEQAARAGGSRIKYLSKDDTQSSVRQVLCTDKLESLGWSPISLGYDAIRGTVNLLREAIPYD